MNTLPAMRPPLPVLTDEVLSLVARLHPDEALARLAPLWTSAKPGLGKRALLAARIALMRKAMVAAPAAEVPPEPEPEPVVEVVPEPVFVPAPKPPSLNRGALTLLNLEDAAKMLMAGGGDADEDDAPAPVMAPSVSAGAAPVAENHETAKAELADVLAVEAALVAAKGRKTKARAAKPAVVDMAAQFADLAGETVLSGDAMEAGLALIGMTEADLAATPDQAAAGLPAPPAAKPKPKAKAKAAALDLSAQFAAMDGDDAPAPKPAALDLSAQFAAMDGDDAPAPKPAALDLSAQFAAMEEGAVPARPAATKGKATMIDLSAQFAAMDDD